MALLTDAQVYQVGGLLKHIGIGEWASYEICGPCVKIDGWRSSAGCGDWCATSERCLRRWCVTSGPATNQLHRGRAGGVREGAMRALYGKA